MSQRRLERTDTSPGRIAIVTAALLLLWAPAGPAGAGGLDPTFGQGGIVRAVRDSIGGWLASLPNGGAVVTANINVTTPSAGQGKIVVAQVRPDGSLDPAFGGGGVVYPAFRSRNPGDRTQDGVQALRRQPDGHIVIAGPSGHADSLGLPDGYSIAVMRLLPDGTPDASFGTGGSVLIEPIDDERVVDLAIQSDGGIVIGGDAAFVDRRKIVLRRVDSTGAVDTTFGSGGVVVVEPDAGATNQIEGLALGPDSITAVGVAFEGPNELEQVSVVASFHADGTPDDQFGAGGMVVLRNGEWPVAAVDTPAGLAVVTSHFGAFRLLDDGSIDGGFGFGGFTRFPFGSVAFAFAIAIDPENRLVLAGEAQVDTSHPQQAALARLTADGWPDSDFGAGGALLTPIGSNGTVIAVDVLPDGRILGGGFGRPDSFTNETIAIRYDPARGGVCAPASARVWARRLGPPLGDELVSVVATFDPGADTVVSPSLGELRLAIVAGDGTPLLNVATPGGVFDRRFGDAAWRVRSGDRSWLFIDPNGTRGVRSLVVKRLGDGKVRVRIRLQQPIALTRDDLPVRVRIDVHEGVCAVATFAEGECAASSGHAACRWR